MVERSERAGRAAAKAHGIASSAHAAAAAAASALAATPPSSSPRTRGPPSHAHTGQFVKLQLKSSVRPSFLPRSLPSLVPLNNSVDEKSGCVPNVEGDDSAAHEGEDKTSGDRQVCECDSDPEERETGRNIEC